MAAEANEANIGLRSQTARALDFRVTPSTDRTASVYASPGPCDCVGATKTMKIPFEILPIASVVAGWCLLILYLGSMLGVHIVW
ncbi:MAG: hypothetical protein WBX25_28325 [Rhodomicrobium sp.]